MAGLTLTPNGTTTRDVTFRTTQSGPGAVLATRTLPGSARDISVDPVTNRCFVSVGDEVLAFDGSGNLLATFRGLWSADGLARDGNGNLYVNQRTGGRITKINMSTLTVEQSWPTTHPTTGGLAFAGVAPGSPMATTSS